jgi:hypothetical protein
MNLEWVKDLLPLLNATGIPLLAIGILLLLRAYQNSVQTYKDVTSSLKDENERLRTRLTEVETSYYGEMDKARDIAIKSMEAIEKLRIQKTKLLSETSADSEELVSEVKKINEAIRLLGELSTAFKLFDEQMRVHIAYTRREFSRLLAEPTQVLERIADVVRDDSSRLEIVQILNLAEVLDVNVIDRASETSSSLELKKLLATLVSELPEEEKRLELPSTDEGALLESEAEETPS